MARFRWSPRDDIYTLNRNIAVAKPGYFKGRDSTALPCIRVAGSIVFVFRDNDGIPCHPYPTLPLIHTAKKALHAAKRWIAEAERTFQEDDRFSDACWWSEM